MDPTSPLWTEEHQAAAEPDFYGKWISVENSLPLTVGDMAGKNYLTAEVIVATKHFVSTDTFVAGNTFGFWSQFKAYKKEVTHWMPLPGMP